MFREKKSGTHGPGSFSLITLGCKSNQYDSAAMAADLGRAGLTCAELGEADIILVNTCMVTGPTEAQCRKAIRQARRANPGAKLVVSGCMIRGAREQVAELPEVDMILDPRRKGMLIDLLGLGSEGSDNGGWADWPEDPAVISHSRDRAFLKIQDGCDSSCSFCIVPSVRDSSRSLEPDRVRDAVRSLMVSGYLEVVLSGVHLGQYGRDLDPPFRFEDLLRRLLEESLPGRVRLSSMEPLEITNALVDNMKRAQGFICRHIHVPVQSGSDRILRLMGRPYTARDLKGCLERLKEALPGIGLGCDLICGFPGETSGDFAMTEKILADFAIPFVHAFPYSPRPGTRAALLCDDVPYQEKKDRVRRLRSLAAENRKAFALRQVGTVLTVALETGARKSDDIWGVTDNYLRAAVRDQRGLRPGGLEKVYIEGVLGDALEGRPVSPSGEELGSKEQEGG